ncbi:MAG TPA: energy transducer TonB [Bryobacteraceae bacterium]|nr:energy transducer TonB [Bryobacteraceae bacterium]
MGTISTQSIFQSTTTDKSWRSYVGSVVVHSIIVVLILTVTIPAVHPIRKAAERITLIAPVLPKPEYRVHIVPQIHVAPPAIVARKEPKLPPVLPKVVEVIPPKPVPQKPVVMAAAPEMKNIPPTPQPVEIKPELPASPKPAVQTGVFQPATDLAKNTPAPKVAVGGFGDPNGAAPSANSKPEVTLAKVGSFDAPNGSGSNGGGGHTEAGGVKQTAFGSAGMAGAGGSTHAAAGQIKASGFNDSTSQIRNKTADASATPAMTPVEILFKPRPAYTPEARNLRLEGQVSLEVVFLSSGAIRVVRVVHGLGHGLDEAAEHAAMQVRFKPAMRGGVPIDTNATINITFELT